MRPVEGREASTVRNSAGAGEPARALSLLAGKPGSAPWDRQTRTDKGGLVGPASPKRRLQHILGIGMRWKW